MKRQVFNETHGQKYFNETHHIAASAAAAVGSREHRGYNKLFPSKHIINYSFSMFIVRLE